MRKHKLIQWFIGICFFGICLFGIFYQDVSNAIDIKTAKKGINSWVNENLSESDTLQYDVSVRFRSHGKYIGSEDDVVYVSRAELSVKVDKISKTAEFYDIKMHYNRDYNGKNYKNISDSYYLKSDNGNVYLYIPKDGVYEISTIQNESLAEALENILFYNNADWLNVENVLYTSANDYTSDYHYCYTGNIDCSFLYAIFSDELPYNTDIIVKSELIRGDYYPKGDPRFIVDFMDVENIFYPIADIFSKGGFRNPVVGDDIKMSTSIETIFPINYDEKIEIKVPDIDI